MRDILSVHPLAVTGAFLLLALPAWGQTVELSLEQARTLLLRHSAVLKADRLELVQADATMESEMAPYVPRLSANYNPGQPGNPLSPAQIQNNLQVGMPIGGGSLSLGSWVLPDSGEKGSASGLQLQWKQPLLRGGRLVGLADRWRVASLQREAKRAKLEADAFNELYQLEQSYWDWLQRQMSLKLLQEEVGRARTNQEFLQIRIKAHVAAEFELDETDQAIAQYESQVLDAQQQLAAAETTLVSQLGMRPATGPMQPVGDLPLPSSEPKLEDLTKRALEVNPELKELRCQAEISGMELALTRHDSWPDLSVNMSADWAGQGTVGSLFPNVSGQAPNILLGATVETPLGVGTEAAAAKDAEARDRAMRIRLEQAVFALKEQIKLKLLETERLRRRLELTTRAQEAAARRYEAERQRFERGVVGVQELIRYQQALSQSRQDALGLRIGLRQAHAKLMQLTGDPAALPGLKE